MRAPLFVHLLPQLFEPMEVAGSTVVILDILRASTTMIHALASGARAVIPTLEVADARAVAERFATEDVILGGEREGLLIPGFDLDNNPFAYTPERVGGKTVVFSTTNGTKALLAARAAERIFVGAFVNLSALVDVLAEDSRPIHLVCAGTRGKVTQEDVLCAGAILERLLIARGLRDEDLTDDQAQLAFYRYVATDSIDHGLLIAMQNSFGGRNCHRLGFDNQVARCATFDLFDLVPVYDATTGALTALSAEGPSTATRS